MEQQEESCESSLRHFEACASSGQSGISKHCTQPFYPTPLCRLKCPRNLWHHILLSNCHQFYCLIVKITLNFVARFYPLIWSLRHWLEMISWTKKGSTNRVPRWAFFSFDPNPLVVVELQWINFNCTFVHLHCLFVCQPFNVYGATIDEILITETEQASTFWNSYRRASNFVDFYL